MKPLGPDEGLNALRHPDCRTCAERERLGLGQLAEIKALKEKLAPVEAKTRLYKQQRDELLAAIEAHRTQGNLAPRGNETAADRNLYRAAERVRKGKSDG